MLTRVYYKKMYGRFAGRQKNGGRRCNNKVAVRPGFTVA